ncbi:MAG TPA: hypothetical protein VGB71_10750 [Flavisolibacter sp.]
MRSSITAYALLLSCVAHSQRSIDVTKVDNIGMNTFFSVGGAPFVNAKFVRLKSGTPYFSDNWMKGKGLAAEGKVYSAPAIRLNLLDDQIIFMDATGNEFVASIPLKQLILIDTINAKEYNFFHATDFPTTVQLKSRWYLNLVTGRAELFVTHRKQLYENKPYGSATMEQEIGTVEQYFIYTGGVMHEVRKPKEIPGILLDKKPELEAYLKKANLKDLPLPMQLSDVVSYYNNLHQ